MVPQEKPRISADARRSQEIEQHCVRWYIGELTTVVDIWGKSVKKGTGQMAKVKEDGHDRHGKSCPGTSTPSLMADSGAGALQHNPQVAGSGLRPSLTAHHRDDYRELPRGPNVLDTSLQHGARKLADTA